MSRHTFSIRVTLFVIIAVLNLFITVQVGYALYGAWISHRNAKSLKEASIRIDLLFNAEKFLSLERGASMAVTIVPQKAADVLTGELLIDRREAEKALNDALGILEGSPRNAENLKSVIAQVKTGRSRLQDLRQELDENLLQPQQERNQELPDEFFNASTELITDIHGLIEAYSLPFMIENPTIVRQMRFSHTVWNITEYAGREYAILGQAIARNRFLSEEDQVRLLKWRGRIQYGWELVHTSIANSAWAEPIRPVMDEAETHYFMTFDQIRTVLYGPDKQTGSPIYPITVEMWLELATQAVDSLHAMNDAVLEVNRLYVARIESDAEREILLSLFLFASALVLSFYSWYVINVRVIRPINSMVDTLYRATHGQPYEAPQAVYYHDEIGKLASVLNAFQENSQQLEIERDRAQAANTAKSEFLANMSHEIRTPINVVLGLAGILGKTSPLSSKQAEFVKTLQLGAESLLLIINDLLDFSKIENRTLELETIPFSLTSLVDDVVQLMSLEAKKKNLVFRAEFNQVKDKEFIGDPTRLRQILINLCGNAIKFTEKGSIVLRVDSRSAPRPGHDEICISIIDTGIGIEASKMNLIFEKFTQADSSINRKYGGTGLGLAIAKSFTEIMGGTLQVESVFGQGATFKVCLTLKSKYLQAETPSLPQIPSSSPMPEGSPGRRVLLVEDYAPNILVAGTFLEEFGYEYDVAGDGLTAAEKANSGHYMAVLMDIQMPGISGLEATALIRKHEADTGKRRVHILGMTAYALAGDKERCLAAGMDDYIAKPFDSEDLKAKLAALAKNIQP